jgi:hypothetical protein
MGAWDTIFGEENRMRKYAVAVVLATALVGSAIVPATVVKAGPGFTHPPGVEVSFCESHFFFGSADYPNFFVDAVEVFASDGSFVEEIDRFGHNAEWVDVGYPIGSLHIIWGTNGFHRIQSFSVDAPGCGGSGMIYLYVYSSVTPFFGGTHTITLFSAAGFPSKSSVTAAAGGTLPEGFTYGQPSCWGALYDDGTDKGTFICDAFLAGLGERRAFLRNDPEGQAFDLLPKIEKYLGMLKGMGIQPQLP